MTSLSAEYIGQVLRDRGIKAPSVQIVRRFVSSLSGAEEAATATLVRKIAQGVEQADDVQGFLDRIAGMPLQPTAPASSALRGPAIPRAVEAHARREQAFLRAHGIHIYGQQAALKVELDTLASEEDAPAEYTLRIEGARKAGGPGYEWTAKIPFQLTRRELPVVAAFLLGYAAEKVVELKYHGQARDKYLHLADQGGNLFIKLGGGGQAVVAVPVEPGDVFAWGELCLLALHLNRPSIGTEAQLALLRRIGQMAGPKRK